MDRLVLRGSVQERHFIYPSFRDDSGHDALLSDQTREAVSEKKQKARIRDR